MATKVTITEKRVVSTLRDDPKNARRHSEDQIEQIARSITRFGYVTPVIVRPDGQIIGGHATVAAFRRLQVTEIEVRVVAGLSESGYKALGIALNKLPEMSRWDENILRDVLTEIEGDGEELDAVGFSRSELDKLMAEPDEIEVKEIETGDVEDEFWISIRGPLPHQAAALKALREAMKPFSGVTVEQGTIAIG